MAGIGSLIVSIGADISGIRRDAEKGAKSLNAVEGATNTLSSALKALAVGVAAKQLVSMVKGAMDAVDASAKLARQLGGTINGLQGLKLAASEAGVSESVLISASERLNRTLGETARKGAGEAHEALKLLGLDARELSAMDADERVAELADAFRESGFSAQETADTLARLGIRQAEFTRIIMDGGGPIRASAVLIRDLGLALSEVDAAKVEAANDAIERVKLASTATAQQLAVQLSPVITAVSNQLIDLAKDAAGVENAVSTVVEVGITGLGYLGDAARGVHLVFKAVELAAWALGTAIVDVSASGAQANAEFVDGALTGINKVIEAYNRFASTDIEPIGLVGDSPFIKDLIALSATMHATLSDVEGQIKTLATEEWPSDKAQKFFAKIQAAADDAAQAVVESRRQLLDFGGGEDDGEGGKADSELEKLRARLATQLEALREYGMSEEELENTRHARRLSQLNAALDQQLVSLADFASISEGIERKHMEALVKIRKVGMDKAQGITFSSMAAGVKQITGMLSSLTSSAAKENRTMFNVNKAFAISDAVVSGAQGVAKTLGAYPMPIAAIFATAHAALAGAQVGLIAAQQFEGGGGRAVAAPGVSGGGASFGGAGGIGPQSQSTGGAGGGITGGGSQLVSLNLMGDTFGRGSILALIDEINEAISDGARIVVE